MIITKCLKYAVMVELAKEKSRQKLKNCLPENRIPEPAGMINGGVNELNSTCISW